jgi:hypothetical protein
VPPPWADLDALKDKLNQEKLEKGMLSEMPQNFKEVFNILTK